MAAPTRAVSSIMVGEALVDIWRATHRSVCSIRFRDGGEVVGGGTGFRIGRYLVTNHHVVFGASVTDAIINFVAEDGFTSTLTKHHAISDVISAVRAAEDASRWDYAILDAVSLGVDEVPPLDAAETAAVIGTPVVSLGYHFTDDNLAMHAGIVASTFERAGVEYLQLDASINHGNSGGPLLRVGDGKVVGVVTRKATGLTKAFDDLMKSFDANAALLKKAQGGMSLGGVDLAEAAFVAQNQMKRVSAELARSANVGIGYAYSVRHVASTIANNP